MNIVTIARSQNTIFKQFQSTSTKFSNLRVKLKYGKLLGKKNKTVYGTEYYSFSGIPYAKSPIGKLRFKDPQSPTPWSGIKDAIKESQPAAQYDVSGNFLGSDDCLYLNVHTPKLTSKDPLPVIVRIHRGGYARGSGSTKDLGPDYLIAKDVVFVSLNYRLGVMGFLCTDPVNARGDMGLKDQNMALRWIKENIEAFNGDRDNVTLLGISAGAASVEYHLMSRMSRDLFHKAIMHSGSMINPWARTRNGVELSVRLAKAMGYKSESGERLFDFIDKFETKDILRAARTILDVEDIRQGNMFPFTPAVNEFKDGKGFIVEGPIKTLNNGDFHKVPIISGGCNLECMNPKMLYNEDVLKQLKTGKLIDFVPHYLKKISNLDEKINNIYKNSEDGFIKFTSDLNFTAGVLFSAEKRIKHNPNEFFYQFCYDGTQNMGKTMAKLSVPGAGHGDDIAYIGPCQYVDHNTTNKDDTFVKESMTTMWTDFAKTGNPTPFTLEWLPIRKHSFQYLNIDKKIELLKDLNVERRNLWREIYDNMS